MTPRLPRATRPAQARWHTRPTSIRTRRCQAAAVSAGGADVGAAATTVSAEAQAGTLQEGELVILLVRPSAWMFSGRACVASLIVVIAGLVCWAIGVLNTALAPILLVWLAAVAWSLAEWRTRWYILTDRRVLSVRGLIRTTAAEVLLTAVSKVRASRSPAFGAFGVGAVTTIASRDGAQVVWSTVRGPEALRDRIAEIVRRYGRRDAEVE